MKLRMRRDGLNVLSLEMGRVYVLCGPAQLSSDVVSLTSVMHIVLERSNGGFPPPEHREMMEKDVQWAANQPTVV